MGARAVTRTLVVMALALRVLIPGGFMPVAAADGSIAIAVCGSEQAIRIAIPGKKQSEPPPRREAAPCAFAGNDGGLPPLSPPAPIVQAPAYAPGELALVASRAVPIRALPPATGPPLFD